MNVYILNTSLKVLAVIDDFYSLGWIERHPESGEFELELPSKYNGESYLALDNLVAIPDSDVTMMIASKQPVTDQDGKESFVIKGESVESLLKRRWTGLKIDVSSSVENNINFLVYESLIDPADTTKKVSWIDDAPYGAPVYPADTYINQFEIGSIYDMVMAICKATGFGIRFIRGTTKMKFEIYKGQDRTASVIFAPQFGNVNSSSYFQSEINAVNLVYVVTEDLVYPIVGVWEAGTTEPSGSSRRETTIETTIDRDLAEGYSLTDGEVLAIIQTRGRQHIIENRQKGLFEGDFDIYGNFKLGVDFDLGDIVTTVIQDVTTTARVSEILRSYSVDGVITNITMDFIDG